MELPLLSSDALQRALHLRDLTDPLHGPHAMQLLLADMHHALAARWGCPRLLQRASPVVSVADNYDRLGYPPTGSAREARYTRYLTPRFLLRTQTSAMIPSLLRSLALDPPPDILLICPGVVYRRDTIDRFHTGEPHQVDLWRVAQHPLTMADLHEMVDLVVAAALPERRYRVLPTTHPYTTEGLQIDVQTGAEWVEIGECGLAASPLLSHSELPVPPTMGLAMGLGLDRVFMLRKGITDIRLLRAEDPRIVRQMLDLTPYVPVSRQPPIYRDLSLAVDETMTAEDLGGRIRDVLGEQLTQLESIDCVTETPAALLSAPVQARLGIQPGQKNVLLRLGIRDPVRTLTSAEATALCHQVFLALHQGAASERPSP